MRIGVSERTPKPHQLNQTQGTDLMVQKSGEHQLRLVVSPTTRWWFQKYVFNFYPETWGKDPSRPIFFNSVKPPGRLFFTRLQKHPNGGCSGLMKHQHYDWRMSWQTRVMSLQIWVMGVEDGPLATINGVKWGPYKMAENKCGFPGVKKTSYLYLEPNWPLFLKVNPPK